MSTDDIGYKFVIYVQEEVERRRREGKGQASPKQDDVYNRGRKNGCNANYWHHFNVVLAEILHRLSRCNRFNLLPCYDDCIHYTNGQ